MQYISDTLAPHAAITGIAHVALHYNTILQWRLHLLNTPLYSDTEKRFFKVKGPMPFKYKKIPATEWQIKIC
jgi:hypothetical protein